MREQRRRELAEHFGVDRRALYREGARWSVAELLGRFITAEHPWRPGTRSSHTSVLLRTAADQIGVAEVALAADPDSRARWEGLFVAEQTQLLFRLAADSGARRGGLAARRMGTWPAGC